MQHFFFGGGKGSHYERKICEFVSNDHVWRVIVDIKQQFSEKRNLEFMFKNEMIAEDFFILIYHYNFGFIVLIHQKCYPNLNDFNKVKIK